MKIKLKESQLINILKKEYDRSILSENDEGVDDKLVQFIRNWAALRAGAKDGDEDAFGKFIFSSLGIDVDKFNPKFDVENASEFDFKTIDMWPINNTSVTSGYGPRSIGGSASKDHKGVDLAAKSGTPIYSPANGVVVASRDAKGKCGGFIKIDHGKYETKYCHVRKFDVVKKGDNVIKGQLIGYTGGGSRDPYKGNSMGPHLHYEVLVGGTHVNPERVHTSLS